MQRITIVGGSLAGLRAASSLRREGFDGTIRIISAEDHLPVDRPPLSKQVLAGTWEPDKAALRGVDEADADWLLGRRAVALDVATHAVALDDGSSVDGDGVVIACGATPRRMPPSVIDPELTGVYELRTLADCAALRAALGSTERVVVIGAGFIGSEVAATSRGLGLDVTVVEMLPIPLERVLGAEMGRVCARLHTDNGVDLRLGVGLAGLEGAGRVDRVKLADGTSIEADTVVIGVGVTPDVAWLEGSGLELRDGVVCDSRCVAAPGVVAAGDVARWYHEGYGEHVRVEHWTNASEQGAAAAVSLLRGDEAPPYRPVPYFWSDQHGTKIQFIGHNAPGDTVAVVEGSPDEGRFVATYSDGPRVTAVLLWNRPARLPHWMDQLS
ncbi:MAG: NAD(P)/FAD-dependent oxidoreductase [Acidimicrobiales bacterium]